MFWFHPSFVVVIPALILAFWAQAKVKRAYRKYSQVASESGMTGYQVARYILNNNGLTNVEIEPVAGELSDHYDPRSRTVRLSEGIYNNSSVASLGIAAHEVGHALQHAEGYQALKLRHALLRPANLGSSLAFPLFFAGIIFSSLQILMTIGIVLFAAALAFHVVTLPVEYNASSRAIKNLRGSGLLAGNDVDGAKAVLSAAALTYVASAAMALAQLIQLLILRDSE